MNNKIYEEKQLKVEDIIQRIISGIHEGKEISYFTPFYKLLSQKTAFLASTLENEYLYRARLLNDKLFLHENELKCPPQESVTKGRLNDNNEQVVYMSLDEIAPITELDIGYYKIYCIAKIKHVVRDTLFHYVGIKGEYKSDSSADIRINEFYMQLLNNKDKEYYNATIALGRHFLKSGMIMNKQKFENVGMIYNSVHEEITNKSLYNLAVYPYTFDKCFKIEEATYNLLTYDPLQNACVVYDLNKGYINSDGFIIWKKTYEEMMEEFNCKFSNNIFRFSEQAIVHYKYSLGSIESQNNESFIVSFRGNLIEIKKEEINNNELT